MSAKAPKNTLFLLAVMALVLHSCGPSERQPSTAGADSETTVLYNNARLILGDGGLIENGSILVEGSIISAIGATGTVRTPAGADVIDLSGRTVMPAMIDAHAHLGYEGYTGWGAEHYTRENLLEHLNRYAYYGFSAVFSAGSDPDDLALQISREQRNGELGGARFLFAAGMGPPGQGPNDRFLEQALHIQESTGMTVLRGLASPADVAEVVRDVRAKDIPFIKIWVDDRGGSQQKLRPEIYRPLIAEARRQGIKVFVHQQFASDMPDLLEAGVDGFLHGRLGPELDRRLAERIAAAGAFVVPNLGLGELRRERIADDPFLQEAVLPQVVERLGEAFDRRPGGTTGPQREQALLQQEQDLQNSMAALLAAGVDIVLGTDAGAVPDHFFGYTGHRELEIYVRLGMTPMQALEAATSKAAGRLGLDDSGSLAAGKNASFIVLAANPLDDIRNTRSIEQVYLAGRRVDRDGLRRAWLSH